MRHRDRSAATLARALAIAGVLLLMSTAPSADPQPTIDPAASADDAVAYFRSTGKQVLTFIGYSAADYEDVPAMLAQAQAVLDEYDPSEVIVNIGATADGIGAVYALAKRKGFATAGIVSTQAKVEGVALSPHVERVFYVDDARWGGIDPHSGVLSPTSRAMVAVSDIVVGLGGGDVARDELIAAKRAGKSVRYVPAEMNHAKAVAKAKRKGRPEPTDFRGSAGDAF
jgi:hypothetical protein